MRGLNMTTSKLGKLGCQKNEQRTEKVRLEKLLVHERPNEGKTFQWPSAAARGYVYTSHPHHIRSTNMVTNSLSESASRFAKMYWSVVLSEKTDLPNPKKHTALTHNNNGHDVTQKSPCPNWGGHDISLVIIILVDSFGPLLYSLRITYIIL